jgi:hypothetical protein
VGTPAWCLLADDDPAKQAAIFDAARHWALRLEMCQEARIDAADRISLAVPWPEVAQYLRSHNEFNDSRSWMKRVAS